MNNICFFVVVIVVGMIIVVFYVMVVIKVIIGIVNNGDMVCMQGLFDEFEKFYFDIDLDWVVLEENVLCQCLIIDIVIDGGQFDVMIIGMYEVLIWGEKGWLMEMDDLLFSYDLGDIFLLVIGGLLVEGKLYVLLFYVESLMIFYCWDLFDVVGLSMFDEFFWD